MNLVDCVRFASLLAREKDTRDDEALSGLFCLPVVLVRDRRILHLLFWKGSLCSESVVLFLQPLNSQTSTNGFE